MGREDKNGTGTEEDIDIREMGPDGEERIKMELEQKRI